MDVVLAELGRRAAEKWVSLLTLPGLLFIAAAAAGRVLGHTGWADVGTLADAGRRAAADLAREGTLTVVMAAALLLLLATAAGLAATAAGRAVRLFWLAEGRIPPGPSLIARRSHRWEAAQQAYADHSETVARRIWEAGVGSGGRAGPGDSGDPAPPVDPARQTDSGRPYDPAGDAAELDRLADRRNRICLAEPTRPLWIGDRLAATDARVYAAYGLDLGTAWPRLWLTVPEETRAEVRLAATAFDAAAGLAGWGLLYLLLGAVWWPAAVAGVVVCAVGWRRGRVCVSVYADLVESVVDLHGRPLAQALGLTEDPGPMTEELGTEITAVVRKGA
ncbi:hypothetical protein [Streptomyces sp. enrichment culture]|uniref:hypothetical protein n=1 Tax=Streptomyces sp. enrichment culture TaxID=1795815 RepID=UPI003F56188A